MTSTFTRATAVVALSLGLGLASPAVAFASGHQPATNAHGAPSATGNAAVMRAYALARLNITRSFQSTVIAARTTLTAALASATTSAQRATAQDVFRSSLTAALAARASALTTLGKPPVRNASATVLLAQRSEAFGASMRAINQTFVSTVAAARTTYHAALMASTTLTARTTARTAFTLALKSALSARRASIVSLGAAPAAS